jgi:hypothetical protein
MKYKSLLTIVGSMAIVFWFGLILALTFKGKESLNHYSNTMGTEVGSPFESSNSSSRYALVEAIVKDKTIALDLPRAEFASPDVVKSHGKYFTIFAPGVSFFAIPFYILGMYFNLQQVTTYIAINIVALTNTLLIIYIAKKLTNSLHAALISGFIFLCGTNALVYAQTLTQHHLTILCMLIAFALAIQKKSPIKTMLIGFVSGMAVLMDIPNILIVAPIAVYAFFQTIEVKKEKKRKYLSVQVFSVIALLLGGIVPLTVYGYYNTLQSNSPTRVAQMIGRTDDFSTNKVIVETPGAIENTRIPFDSRLLTQGLQILLLSDERGLLYYSPAIAIGLLGIALAYKNKTTQNASVIGFAICSLTITLYASFGDPWGGWSFGPRYLLPVYAVLAIFSAFAIQKFRKNYIVFIIFIVLITMSITINTLGALTTQAVPPKNEALNLIVPIPYTFEYGRTLITKENFTSSLVYNLYLKNTVKAKDFAVGIMSAQMIVMMLLYVSYIAPKKIKVN